MDFPAFRRSSLRQNRIRTRSTIVISKHAAESVPGDLPYRLAEIGRHELDGSGLECTLRPVPAGGHFPAIEITLAINRGNICELAKSCFPFFLWA